ncbi:15325_t:CDS:2 [Cetraspora pellucida]|uniref:15325_t:CDS:1 n=1 Tax=Cetraspora pellucida TaxID=1433469 RepID=A0A9N8VFI4_9GLOM|nr:15325_t:CDS:2 [Cetraspora pellucida]
MIQNSDISLIILFGIVITFSEMGSRDNNLEKTILALSNELERMRTEVEWKNDTASQAGSNRFSSTSHEKKEKSLSNTNVRPSPNRNRP